MELKKTSFSRKIGLKTVGILIVVLTVLISIILLITANKIIDYSKNVQTASDEYIKAQLTASQLKQGSDNLTEHVRSFVVTGKTKYLDYYLKELLETKTYDNAYEELAPLLDDANLASSLEMINSYETKLKELEGKGILLALYAYDISNQNYYYYFKDYRLTDYEKALDNDTKHDRAISMVFGGDDELVHFGDYDMHKKIVNDNIEIFVKQLSNVTKAEQESSITALNSAVVRARSYIVTAMVLMLSVAFIVLAYVVAPLVKNIQHINSHEYLELNGVREMGFLASAYNEMLTQVKDDQDKLSYEASHDALTGLYNRQAFLSMYQSYKASKICFLHIDIDNFKEINDSYGHDIGDRILQKVAKTLNDIFRSNDLIFRMGGDEFAVIMVGIKSDDQNVVKKKAKKIMDKLADTKDGLPYISVSIGATFSHEDGTDKRMYKESDLALYEAKNNGKGRIVFFDDKMLKK